MTLANAQTSFRMSTQNADQREVLLDSSSVHMPRNCSEEAAGCLALCLSSGFLFLSF